MATTLKVVAADGDDAGSIAPSRDIAVRSPANLGGRGIFGVELFVKGEQVWFSEVSPRPHDTGLVTTGHAALCRNSNCTPAPSSAYRSIQLRRPGRFSAVIYGNMNETGIAFEGVDLGAARCRSRISACSANPRAFRPPPHGRGCGQC
jgi:phosphoribosylglycinamide formyltransferase 2